MSPNGEPGRIRLVVNADDLGASEAVNRGVVRACREGLVTSATLMAGGRAFGDAVLRVDDLPALGVGVHLTLAAGEPVLAPEGAPTLIGPDRSLPRDAAAFARAFWRGRISLADIRAELRAQIARVAEAGVRITHLDSHQHLHHFPGVAAVVIELAREFGLRAVRVSRCRLWPPGRRWPPRQLALRFYAEVFGARARRAGLRMPDGLEGQEWPEGLTEERLLRVVGRLVPGTWELLCHPREGGEEVELRVLTSPAVRASLEERGVRLINYAAL